MRWTGRGLRVLAVALAVSLAVVGPAWGVGVGDVDPVAQTNAQLQEATPTPANDTARHEDPDRVEQAGDLAAVRRWLAGRMAVELEDCAVAIGRGTTDVCELGEAYPDWLRKYVDVADETATEADDRQAEQFKEAANRTQSLAERTSEFRETRREYERAREAGNVTEARRLARELFRLGRSIDADAEEVVSAYEGIERGDGVELVAAKESVNRTRENVTEAIETVEAELFVRTTITADLDPRSISFLRPGTVTGRLVTANGSVVASRTIELRIGNRTVSTTTDGTGRFTVGYRPVTLPADAERLVIRYVPQNESVYLAANTSIPVSVSPVEPVVEVSAEPASASYGREITVSGRVSAGALGVPAVPVVVSVGGRRIGTVHTDDEGRFSMSTAIEATDGPGAVVVRASLPLEGRAVAATGANASLTVSTTGTVLDIDPGADGAAVVTVAGTLATEAGQPVADRAVTIRLNGTAVATVRTGPDGTFRASVDVPSSLGDGNAATAVAVEAAFTGSGTNLDGSTARAVVRLPAVGPPRARGPVGVAVAWYEGRYPSSTAAIRAFVRAPGAWLVVLGGLVILGLGLLLWRFGGLVGVAPAPSGGGRSRAPETGTASDLNARTPPPIGPMEAAQVRLEVDANEAVMLAYAAVRESLSEAVRPGSRPADTHWEFLAACRGDGLDDDAIEGLTELTAAYEQAAFASVSVSAADARAAMATGERLLTS